jgi:membrane-associated protease RseP (regulator of RpoE activity)
MLNITSDKGTFDVLLKEHPTDAGKGYIGIVTSQYYNSPVNMKILTPISGVLFWVFLLYFNIGLINLFPLPFLFDGGKIFKEIVDIKFSEANSNAIQKVFAVIGILLFAINILPSFL